MYRSRIVCFSPPQSSCTAFGRKFTSRTSVSQCLLWMNHPLRPGKMASFSAQFTAVLIFLLHFSQIGAAKNTSSFCPLTLSRPTCPNLQTYDKFDITTYGGRWFEIGSSANFKNVEESDGICVIANYTLQQAPSPGRGGVVGVVNTLYSLGKPRSAQGNVVISLSSGQICSQAFMICAETDPTTTSNSSLAQGLALVSDVAVAIEQDCPGPAGALTCAKDQSEGAIKEIDLGLDTLSKLVSRIQVLNAQLGQEQGNTTYNVAALIGTVAELNGTTIALGTAVGKIENAREAIGKVGGQLEAKGDVLNSDKLDKALELITTGEGLITTQLTQIQGALSGLVGVAGLFLAPSSKPKGYTFRIVGVANQNASFAGKLTVQFPGNPAGGYWVLAVEEEGPDGGYAATLVYGCDQNSGGGGIEETLFILSRTPTLPSASVKRLLAKATELGVTRDCSTPFIFTVQSPSCGNPPSDIPPYYS